jgi:hypothetical protein
MLDVRRSYLSTITQVAMDYHYHVYLAAAYIIRTLG